MKIFQRMEYKKMYMFVKNLAFSIDVESQNVDLGKANLAAKLLYDFDRDIDPRLEVSYVKNEPLESKVNIFEAGAKAIVELKIKVLTSQHEDMLFRVQLYGIDPLTGQPLEAISKPIKVISKVTQLKKSQSGVLPTLSGKKRVMSHQSNSVPIVTSDNLAHILSRIENQQSHHTYLLNLICRKLYGDDLSALADQSIVSEQLNMGTVGQPEMQQDEGTELESSFQKFLSVVNSIKPEEKQERISGLISALGSIESERLAELLDSFSSSTRKKIKIQTL